MFALKEWAAVVRALELGAQSLLLRKGGIVEPDGTFHLEHSHFLLYPTYEHQKAELLKAPFRHLVEETQNSRKGQLVRITSQAHVRHAHCLRSLADAEPFFERHIFTRDFIQQRLDYKPGRPLWAVDVEVSPLPEPLEFMETQEMVGCRSWVAVPQSQG